MKDCIQVTSQVAERLKTGSWELTKYYQNLKTAWGTGYPVSPAEINFWHWRSKNEQKQISAFRYYSPGLIS